MPQVARWWLAAGLLLGALPSPARADDCATSYERAQEHKSEGRLRSARAELLACTQTTCPAFVQTDCHKWLDEVDAAMPTVVFVARLNGRDADQVRVMENREPLALRLDGRSMALDPGKHAFTFEATGAPPVVVDVLIVEGQKNRVIEVDLRSPADPAGPTTLIADDPWPEHPADAEARPWLKRYQLPLIMAGIGAAGLGAFAAFGTSGLQAERRLEKGCAPACDGADVQSVRDKYLLADIGLAVGVVSLGAAAYLAVRELTAESERRQRRVAWSMMVSPRHGVLVVRTPF